MASLALYNFDINYRAGRHNADALSRLPINNETVQAICHSNVPAYVESITLSPSIVVDDEDPRGTGTGNIIDWRRSKIMILILRNVLSMYEPTVSRQGNKCT